jgi:hypothetical protein
MDLHTLLQLTAWLAVALALVAPMADVLSRRARHHERNLTMKPLTPAPSILTSPETSFLDATAALLARAETTTAAGGKPSTWTVSTSVASAGLDLPPDR